MVSPSAAPSGPTAKTSPSLRSRLTYIYTKDIWQSSVLKSRSPKGILYAMLRVISITITVFMESRAASRAAALSFSSLLGLGPLIAIAVMVGGFMLGKNSDATKIADQIGTLIEAVAPQVKHLQSDQPDTPPANATTGDETTRPQQSVATTGGETPKGAGKLVSNTTVKFVSRIIEKAQSGTGGVFGAISFITIVLFLFKSIEDAFNDIWGVRTRRSVLVRVVFYWTILTLGAVLFFAAIALMTAGAFVNVFDNTFAKLPGGHELQFVLRWSLPLFSVTLIVALLTLVYRVVPNTRVYWRAAFVGALVVAALMLLNQFVALFYVRRVILTQSLYGGVALPLVLMLGMYILWVYLLIGAVVSYAVQNVHFRNSQAAWSTLPEQTRERLTLVVFLTICRRFRECLPPISASQLSGMLKVPTQLVNECLGRLEQLKLVTPVRPSDDETENDSRYQPSHPLNRITLYDFKTLDDTFGENVLSSSLEHIDPLLARYDATLAKVGEAEFFQKSIDELFAEHPFDENRPAPRVG
jgi:membrane protein